MWLGTDKVFDAFTFEIRETPHGVMQMHGYPFDAHGSTFIVEMHDDVWRRAGFDEVRGARPRAGESDEALDRRGRASSSPTSLDGHEVLANNSRWVSFTTVRNERWRHDNVVLLGDAAHTAHFSIGSGTKLAMEDALALAACLHEPPDRGRRRSRRTRQERRPVVLSTQRAAQASLEWFENLGQYIAPARRCSSRSTSSPAAAASPTTTCGCATRSSSRGSTSGSPDPAGAPGTARVTRARRCSRRSGSASSTLANRVVVSPMDMYVAQDGLPGDFHLVHLGGKALGGAGLVMTEMVCVSPARPHHPRLRRTVDRRAGRGLEADLSTSCTRTSPARIGVQLGHCGPKGSTKLMWEGMDQPLPEGTGRWSSASASALQARASTRLRATDRAGMDAVGRRLRRRRPQRAARGGLRPAGAPLRARLPAVGFLSPVTNRRTDEYGGDAREPAAFPLEVFAAVREVWPADRPMTVRISATDWVEGGVTLEDTLEVARAFEAAGAAAIDVSTGQVTPDERPAFGRSYQTPYADAIRNSLHIPTIAVGVISSADDVNTIVLVRARRPLRPRPGPPLRPQLDPARRGRAGLRRPRCAVADALAPGSPQAADRTIRRAEAAARAHPRPGRERRTPALASRYLRFLTTRSVEPRVVAHSYFVRYLRTKY